VSAKPHWTLRPGADDLFITVRPGVCLCDDDKQHVEGQWPIHGWTFHAGQCCGCMNIRVYHNGAQPDDFKDGRADWAEENSDEIHICDLDEFIEMLLAIREKTEEPMS
jgi:hypothetical protein